MKITILASLLVAGLAVSACSTPDTSNGNTASSGNSGADKKTEVNTTTEPAKTEEVPAAVKSALASAESFTTQHKELTDAQVASIEKDTGGKVAGKDHHSYLAFSTASGAKTQIGAVTIVKAGDKEIVVIYENKDGSPVIKEMKVDGVPAAFLSQFAGKGHDNDLLLGVDIKANGAKDDIAKNITDAVRIDVLSMQALYGKAHSH